MNRPLIRTRSCILKCPVYRDELRVRIEQKDCVAVRFSTAGRGSTKHTRPWACLRHVRGGRADDIGWFGQRCVGPKQ